MQREGEGVKEGKKRGCWVGGAQEDRGLSSSPSLSLSLWIDKRERKRQSNGVKGYRI